MEMKKDFKKMGFREAFIECIKGNRIKRITWMNNSYICLRWGKFRIFTASGHEEINLNDFTDPEEFWEIYTGKTYE